MKTIGTLLVVVIVAFAGIFAFYYFERGSLEEAGREVDAGLAQIDRTTKPLQQEVEDIGDATVQSINRATDGDDAT